MENETLFNCPDKKKFVREVLKAVEDVSHTPVVTQFKFVGFRGIRREGEVQEFIVVLLPFPMPANKALWNQQKAIRERLLQRGHWSEVNFLGAVTGITWRTYNQMFDELSERLVIGS